jgi:hypothetical protein
MPGAASKAPFKQSKQKAPVLRRGFLLFTEEYPVKVRICTVSRYKPPD